MDFIDLAKQRPYNGARENHGNLGSDGYRLLEQGKFSEMMLVSYTSRLSERFSRIAIKGNDCVPRPYYFQKPRIIERFNSYAPLRVKQTRNKVRFCVVVYAHHV